MPWPEVTSPSQPTATCPRGAHQQLGPGRHRTCCSVLARLLLPTGTVAVLLHGERPDVDLENRTQTLPQLRFGEEPVRLRVGQARPAITNICDRQAHEEATLTVGVPQPRR